MGIVSEFVDGGSWHLALSLEAKPTDHSCYFTGNFTCNGDGTVSLNREGNLWIGELTLPPGEYTYYFEINQFIKVDEHRAPAESPLKLILKQNGLFHNPDDPSFAGTAGNLFIARCIGPPETGMLQMKFGAGEVKESITSYHDSALSIFEFLVPPEAKWYSFQDAEKGLTTGDFERTVSESFDPGSNIIYQIFPDRFCRAGGKQEGLSDWGDAPRQGSFYGGNFSGILSKLPYLKDLNIKHLYMTPFYKSGSNHRYDADDYFLTDPLLGTVEELANLSDSFFSAGISLIVDVVFNHTSTRYEAFLKALSNRDSPYFHWYKFLKENPISEKGHFVYRVGSVDLPSYESFQGHGGMPKLNHQNPQVQDLMVEVMRYYASLLHVSYFRYDVSDSIDLEVMRRIIPKLRHEFPDIGHIAEIWCLSKIFFGKGLYDGTMNYPLRDMIMNLVSGSTTPEEFNRQFLKIRFTVGEKGLRNMMNLLGSHDTPRIRTLMGSKEASLLSYAILFMFDGMPTIYYGDEVAMEGGPDPDCRRTYPWDSFDNEFLGKIKKITSFREKTRISRDGYVLLSRMPCGLIQLKKLSREGVLELRFALEETEVETHDPGFSIAEGVENSPSGLLYRKYAFTIFTGKRY
ncbi:MAG: alpha-amylase family glycosyl hydrolase [Candidatus Thermoplasmatota archaeon]|nr:alpha-amylase family glycosyl hydrolase [Candidatus Thermoplasmatota archaeon]